MQSAERRGVRPGFAGSNYNAVGLRQKQLIDPKQYTD